MAAALPDWVRFYGVSEKKLDFGGEVISVFTAASDTERGFQSNDKTGLCLW